jgi:hypothetical protein
VYTTHDLAAVKRSRRQRSSCLLQTTPRPSPLNRVVVYTTHDLAAVKRSRRQRSSCGVAPFTRHNRQCFFESSPPVCTLTYFSRDFLPTTFWLSAILLCVVLSPPPPQTTILTPPPPNFYPTPLPHCRQHLSCSSRTFLSTPPVSPTDLSLHLSPSSTITLSTPVSPAEKTWIQQVVGSLLFYARALGLSLLAAVCQMTLLPPVSSTPHNMTSPLPTASSITSPLIATPTKPLTPLPLLSGLHRRQLPVPTKVVQCGWLLGWAYLETPHPTFSIHPQKATDKVGKTISSLSVPPALYNLTPLMYHHPLSPTTPLSMPTASAYPWW